MDLVPDLVPYLVPDPYKCVNVGGLQADSLGGSGGADAPPRKKVKISSSPGPAVLGGAWFVFISFGFGLHRLKGLLNQRDLHS